MALLAISLIVAATMPNQYQIERSLEIQAPIEKIYPLIADFSQWKQWSPWFESEPSAAYTITGPASALGSKMEWNGKIIGKGSLEIKEVTPMEKIVMDLLITEPNEMEAKSSFELKPNGQNTILHWNNEGPLSYPMGRLFGPFLDKVIGRDFEMGLYKIKVYAEKR